MPHSDRPKMKPQPINDFQTVYDKLWNCPNNQISGLITTGGGDFTARAKVTQDGRKFIELPYNNRIYDCCWGNTTNHMSSGGQRIGQYARPLDEWV